METTEEIAKRLEQEMAKAAANMVEPGMVTVRISDIRRLITEWERKR